LAIAGSAIKLAPHIAGSPLKKEGEKTEISPAASLAGKEELSERLIHSLTERRMPEKRTEQAKKPRAVVAGD